MIGFIRMAVIAAVSGAGVTALVGGWAVTTVENPPAALAAGGTYRLEFTIRQHGHTLLDGLSPQVRVLDAADPATPDGISQVTATPAGAPGRYAVTLATPKADSVRLVVVSMFGRGRPTELTLPAVPVLGKGAAVPVRSPAEVGRRLFVAKGCGTCHVNGDVPEWTAWNESWGFAPELTGRRLEASYVRQRLTDPASLPPIGDGKLRMPNLGLSPAEVDALVALLSGAPGLAAAK
jgi:hypothetical protein